MVNLQYQSSGNKKPGFITSILISGRVPSILYVPRGAARRRGKFVIIEFKCFGMLTNARYYFNLRVLDIIINAPLPPLILEGELVSIILRH